MNRSMSLKCLVVLICAASTLWAKPFMGQYKGTFYPDKKVTLPATATVVDEGSGDYRINIHATSDYPSLEGRQLICTLCPPLSGGRGRPDCSKFHPPPLFSLCQKASSE